MKNVIYIDVHFFQGSKEGGPKSTSWWYPFCENCMWVRTWQGPDKSWTHVIIRPHWGELLHRVPSQPTGHATHRWWGRCLTLLAMSKEFCATAVIRFGKDTITLVLVVLWVNLFSFFSTQNFENVRLGRKEGLSTACPNSCGEKCFGFNDFAGSALC